MVVDLLHPTTPIQDASSFVEGARKYFMIFTDMMPLNRIEIISLRAETYEN